MKQLARRTHQLIFNWLNSILSQETELFITCKDLRIYKKYFDDDDDDDDANILWLFQLQYHGSLPNFRLGKHMKRYFDSWLSICFPWLNFIIELMNNTNYPQKMFYSPIFVIPTFKHWKVINLLLYKILDSHSGVY
jgi:hypothetical protein